MKFVNPGYNNQILPVSKKEKEKSIYKESSALNFSPAELGVRKQWSNDFKTLKLK